MLDNMQKAVLSCGVEYSRALVICRTSKVPADFHSGYAEAGSADHVKKAGNVKNSLNVKKASNVKNSLQIKFASGRPLPPLVMVHGGAGSGKSKVITSLYNTMTDILKQPGDDPGLPYVVLTSFTGAASANINGQTIHSLFGFKFGNSYMCMPDRTREERRILFQKLKVVIVDEISMVSADLLYNMDLRFREITQVDEIMGGLAVFLFGDLFQLEPVQARYAFKEPKNREHALSYRLRSLWEQFTVVHLEQNHRQGEDRPYGDLLNRLRVGAHTEEDVELLRTRIVPEDDPALKDALHVFGTNVKVNARNDAKLNEIPGKLYTVKAKTWSKTVKDFPVTNAGCIQNTPFLAELKLKVNAEVVLVHNVNTLDGLTNGARGVLIAVEKTKEGKIKRLAIKFHNPRHGELTREKNPCWQDKDATYIYPIAWQYQLKGNICNVLQLPVKGAAAISSHKLQVRDAYFTTFVSITLVISFDSRFLILYLQGQTVGKPNPLVVDVTSCHAPGMVYVMLSRVQCLDQLNIIKDLEPEKITVDKNVMKEASRMWKVCVNRNPERWMDRENVNGLRLCCLNVRSLRKHIEDVRSDPVLQQADILFVQETWLTAGESSQEVYQLEGYRGFFASQGAGKGVGLYVREGLPQASGITTVALPHMQILKICLGGLDIISVYRSKEELPPTALHHLKQVIVKNEDTMLIGDLNYCYYSEQNAISRFLKSVTYEYLLSNIGAVVSKFSLTSSFCKVPQARAFYTTGDQAYAHRWRYLFERTCIYSSIFCKTSYELST